MEILTPSILSKPHFSSTISPFSPTPSSLTTLTKKTPLKSHKTHLKTFPYHPLSSISPLKNNKKAPIFARFGGPTKRRNSLRKKQLTQVRDIPPNVIDPPHNFDVNDSNLVDKTLEIGNDNVGSSQIDVESSYLRKSRQIGDTVMWDKLDGWVEQYKKDIEFWGIGTHPIFTVFYDDVSGKFERVLVDEDEILRRCGVEPLYFREESRLGVSFDQANSKIDHAEFLARELEGGKNVIPRNSSVAKFVVVGGEKSGFVGKIRSLVVVPRASLGKVSRVGVGLVCGLVLVWVVKKLWSLGGKEREREVSSFKKEMLRRKVKARMEKEKLRKGSVEVVEELCEAPSVVTERPRLDKEVVLKSIREAKGLNDGLVVVDGGGDREAGLIEMDFKIREIQMMARHARKMEKGEGSSSEGDELDEQIPKEMHLVDKDIVEGAENSVQIDELETQAFNVLPCIEKDAADKHDGGDMNFVNGFISENSNEMRIFNGTPEMELLGNLEKQNGDTKFTNENVCQGNEDVDPHSVSSGKIVDDKVCLTTNGVIQSFDTSNSLNLTNGIQSNVSKSGLNPPKKTLPRRKPKIIRSVKEAREYLQQKRDQKTQVGDVPTTAAVKDEGMDNHDSHELGEEGKALESFSVDAIVDPVPARQVSGDYFVKENEVLATDTNEFMVETENKLKQNRPFDSPSAVNLGVDTALNLGEKMKISEILKPSSSHERSDLIPGENNFCDDSQEAIKLDEKVDKFDEMPKSTDLSEISDLASRRNGSPNASNSIEGSSVPHENALDDASLQKNVDLSNDNGNVKLDGISETPKTAELSDLIVPAAAERDLDGSGSEVNAFLQTERSDENDYGKNDVESKPTAETFEGSGSGIGDKEELLLADKENWLENNFHEVEPIVNKIGSGFRNNYNVAREKIKQDVVTGFDLMTLKSIMGDTELEWMQDDKLREIVFKVRDNELAGREPFHSMSAEDKVAFYEGLESKVEKENQKLSTLHEWLHSNIENIDYGADGISIYDPPEKVIPRWKGPPLDTIPDFLNNSKDQQQESSSLQNVNESTKYDNVETSQEASTSKSSPRKKVGKFSKTVIESSDGSVKPGKKSGKEFWQHTKKWSRGFVESYNAETDPEVKSVMKDMGKDLDRWITEKEIQEAADLMDNIPQQGKQIMDKKLNKLKREMELFGPQAVVSKYREYAEDKEEDYLWWLDLPHLLCIEMYTYEGEDQRVGFYSLEMATDLELEPKPQHVIAFQDPGDCKNFCYIIQAHLEMLGKGKAFIVPQPPKDVFRQAKANGFGVTVIRKGKLKLNIDQPLEEVEELIAEIGSKMYHDKIMRERSVDISSLMKGVFGVSPPPPSKRKRKKRARKRPSKS